MYYSVIKRSDLHSTKERRIDADYFSPSALEVEMKIKSQPYSQLKFLCNKVTDFGAYSQMNFVNYLNSGHAKFIRNQDVNGISIENKNPIFVSKEVFNKLSLHLDLDDILIQRTGSIGKAGIVQLKDLPSTANQNLAQVSVNIKKLNPFFLISFFNSKFGLALFKRLQTGNVQSWLNLRQIGSLLIPMIDRSIQDEIALNLKESLRLQEKSQTLYQQATALLEQELGLDKISFDKPKSYTAKFSEVLNVNRFDAEHHKPEYKLIEKLFDKFERIKLKDLVNTSISSGSTPKSGGSDYTTREKGVPFIRVVNFGETDVNLENYIYVKQKVHNSLLKRTQLKNQDVLFSIAGTVGKCVIFNHTFEANINQAVSILRFDESIIKRLYLIMFFNSKIGNLYVKKFARHGVQTNLTLAEVGNLAIPIIDYSIQTKISDLVLQSMQADKQSKQLLQEAKNRVEQLIEEAANP